MMRSSLTIALKDLRLAFAGSGGLAQAFLLGLLLIFVFSLSQDVGQRMDAQEAAAIFWLASVFCQVLIFSMLYGLEESHKARLGLLLMPAPIQAVWLGKMLAGLCLLLLAQLLFLPALIVFLGQNIYDSWPLALLALLLTDIGIVALGSLLGALAQGQAARESLLSILLFPLLIPLLLAGIHLGTACFLPEAPENIQSWLGMAASFDALFLAAGIFLFSFIYTGDD